MTFTTIGTSLVATLAILSALLAGLTIWLLLTNPTTMAGALQDGTVTPLIGELARAVAEAIRGLLAFL